MNLNRTRFVRLIKITTFVLIALILILYATLRTLPYAKGLSIDVYEPTDGATISSSTVNIIGKATRISSLALNGNPISVDESGNFREKIILFTGTNVLVLEGHDQFGRTERTKIIIFRPR